MNWHNMTPAEVLRHFKVDRTQGLSHSAVAHKLTVFGKNKLADAPKKSLILRFFEQFKDFMVIILLAAAAISFVTSLLEGNREYLDSIIILLIVVLNSIVGIIQENKAERAIEELGRLSGTHTKVLRGGKKQMISSEQLVPGDIVILRTGDIVPADIRIIEGENLLLEESALTGESRPVKKSAETVLPAKTPLAERKNMAYSSSIVSNEHAYGVAVETGMNTQVGKIAGLILQEESPPTPLQVKLEKVGKLLGFAGLAICFFIFILGLFHKNDPLETFLVAVSLAVAAIPEGLPAVVTIVLAMGVRRMAANRAVIRKLPAVETLGSATVICSDKTGTLTQNKMTVTKIQTTEGFVSLTSPDAAKILSLCALCNNAAISGEKATGDPTEGALLLAAANAGQHKASLEQDFPKVQEISFNSSRKMMTTIHKTRTGKYRIISKGAPDVVLELSSSARGRTLTPAMKNELLAANEKMAADALRVLGVAYRDVEVLPKVPEDLETRLNFVGLVGMIDPPRPQAKSAVMECKKAGIKPVMITGDHIATATAIARELKILGPGDLSLTGAEIDRMPEETFQKNIFSYSVFARVSPEHKVKIVKAFQHKGAVVAMTGDGVNDAPALKASDIGCAMGISGTDVAKSAADMILTDDNFSTIVEAVRQGRGIFENIRKAVHFLLSSNIGEIITILTAFLLRLPTPLLPIQLLWVNLVTDALPSLALGVDPIDPDIMHPSRRASSEKLFSRHICHRIIFEGIFIGTIAFLAFTIGRVFFDHTHTPFIGRTMAFCVLSLAELVHSFNVRGEKSIFKTGIFSNSQLIVAFLVGVFLQVSAVSIPVFSGIFKTTPLSFSQWIIVALLSFSPVLFVELEKWLYRPETPKSIRSLQTQKNVL